MTELKKRLMEASRVQVVPNHIKLDLLNAHQQIVSLEKALRTLTTKLYADLDGGRKIRRYDVDKAAVALGEKKDD